MKAMIVMANSAGLCVRIQRKLSGAIKDARASHDNPVQYSQGSHNALGEAVSFLIAEMMVMSAAYFGAEAGSENNVFFSLRTRQHLESQLREISPCSACGDDPAALTAARPNV